MDRIMAIDVGRVRIGVALSDVFKTIASPFCSYTRKNMQADIAYLCGLIKEQSVSVVAAGMPYAMDGTKNAQCLDIEGFCEELRRHIAVPLVYIDERFTTALARRALIEGGVRREDRKKSVDMIAASYILQGYLDKHHKKS